MKFNTQYMKTINKTNSQLCFISRWDSHVTFSIAADAINEDENILFLPPPNNQYLTVSYILFFVLKYPQ